MRKKNVKRGWLVNKNDKSCWDVLAEEITKEIREWAQILRHSDES